MTAVAPVLVRPLLVAIRSATGKRPSSENRASALTPVASSNWPSSSRSHS
jgi:hypothetical protein